MEPKQQAKKLERYRNKIGLAQAISNVSNKIWAFVDEVFEVTVMYNMVQQLTLRLFYTESHVEFVLTLIYAKCDAIERIELWDSLYAMARDMDAPWLVGGDFNVIWDEEEMFGSIFTWWNERAKEDCIFKRLDRCLANLQFQQTFPGIEVQHLSKTGSDHSPMYLKCDIETTPIKKPFKFLNFWVKHATFKDVVKENWTADFSANPYILFNHKLKRLKKALSLWRMNKERLQKVQPELIKCLALEEKYWQQKAGMTWFKEGDRNSKFFHAQNAELIKQPTKEEVKMAVLGLNGDSAGGPDGMTRKFYHSCWDIIGDDLYDTVISRVVHERLVKFLQSLISEEQSGFVKGRNIVENILLTQEIVTDIRLRTKAGPNVILKLDMTKAYDRLSWIFLTKSSRGVKQGDHVSPTLFILVTKALSRGLNALPTNLYFCGFGMPKWSPKINHLAYADDMIIFSSSDETSLMLIMQVLNAYEAASGQLVNKTKSAVYLHHLTDMEVVSKVERITGIHRNDFPIIYLGCPIFYARRKLEYYQPLITKVMDKLQSWQGGTSRHWASWNTLCMPVEEGGICFRSLHDVAKALFSKLWWNFRTKPSLWSAFVCQKYCKKMNSDFGIDKTVHNIHDVTLDGEWDMDMLFEMLPKDLAVHILEKIRPPSPQQVLDMPCWMLETRGYFSVKSAWDYTRRRDEPRTTYKMIWVKGLPFKIAFSMWKVWKAKLPLDDFLKRVGYCMPSKCWCYVQPDEESLQHLFFRSETAKTTWKYFLSRAGIVVEGLTLHQEITKCWTANVCLRLKPVMQALPSCVVWELWKRRNSMKYGDDVTTSRMIYQVSSNLQALVKVRKPGMDIVPHKWQDLLAMMENFTPKLKVTKVM
ncbi:uncharacterized protein LOC107830035 [Nicotiana tabacum]|uniref:Uncharacterized protein LOC107830035 n=1 Tax=Nicotiana tabacum TaxID=4097 RepID=A0AC58U5Q2_TOBAC